MHTFAIQRQSSDSRREPDRGKTAIIGVATDASPSLAALDPIVDSPYEVAVAVT